MPRLSLPDFFHHYLGWAILIVLSYFCIINPILKHLDTVETHTYTGPKVVAVQPTPQNVTTRTADYAEKAIADKATIAALKGEVLQLSASQRTIANAVEHLGVNAKLAAAASEGLSRPAPKVETLTVGTQSKVVAPSPGPTDDQIERSMKKVLAESTIKNDTHVTVDWKDKPVSPIFAAYDSDGSSGVGVTIKKAPSYNLDGLFLVGTNSMKLGAGLEHPIKGTGLGAGISLTVDSRTHQPTFGFLLGIHN
jgi:hypothetical protein